MSRYANDTIIAEGGQSLNTNWTSPAIPLLFLTEYAVQLEFTGIIAGTFLLECSNALDANDINAVWTVISGSSQVINEAGDHTWEVRRAGYKNVRVVWQHSAGTGTLTSARFHAKGS